MEKVYTTAGSPTTDIDDLYCLTCGEEGQSCACEWQPMLRGEKAILAHLDAEDAKPSLSGIKGVRRDGKLHLGATYYDGLIGHIPDGKTAEGVADAFSCLGIELRYNIRAHAIEYRDSRSSAVDNHWREMTDRAQAKIREILAERFTVTGPKDSVMPFRMAKERWIDCINVILFDNEIDPLLEWLEELPEWDGVERLDNYIFEVFDVSAESIPLAKWTSRFVFLGTVWRTFQPGIKQDETPVVIGRGGIGKSTMLRLAIPPELPDLFSDSLRFSADDKVRIESLQGKAIVEAAEMSGAMRAEIDSMKAFLSRTDDGSARLAYRRNPERMPRRCIIVGTSDTDRPLPNDHNLRRFVPVHLNGGDPAKVHKYMNANRVQLWAEAVSMYKRGIEARLPDNLKRLQKVATDRTRSGNLALESAIDDFLARQGDTPFRSAELFSAIGLIGSSTDGAKVDRTTERAAGAYLRMCDWQYGNVRIGGVQTKCWHKLLPLLPLVTSDSMEFVFPENGHN